MKTFKLNQTLIEIDFDRTLATYSAITSGGTDQCGCIYCQNFQLWLTQEISPHWLDVLRQLGINPMKDAEVYVLDTINDNELQYAGEYYCWGKIIDLSETASTILADTTIEVRQASPLAPPEFQHAGALCIYFELTIPWLRS